MDKSGTIAKAIVTAPTFEPVREVEHGCEHLQEFMSNPAVSEKLTNSYVNLQSHLGKAAETQTTKDPKDPKRIPMTTLRPTYLCLQCSTISSLEDRDAHCQARKHQLSIESRSGCLWCALCDDFVYDPTFEKIRVDQSGPAHGKKRKLNQIYPSGEEDKFVLPNSNALSCQAGAPRGIYNLGQTCYLSVILQAMIHNPLMRNFFLSSRHDTNECAIDNCIACALTASFTDILATEKLDGHGPIDMLYKSWKNSPDLSGYQQQDAHEYFQSLIDHLHSSSGCITNGKDNKNCSCLYHQIFFGKLRSTVTCLTCRNVTVVEDPIVDLCLDLRQQREKRRKTDQKGATPVKNSTDEPPLDLVQCLRNFTSPEKLQAGDYDCKSKDCGNTPQRVRKHLTIKKLPPSLCITLKRYEHNKSQSSKIDTKLLFPLQIDMSPYTTRAYRNTKMKKNADAGPSFDPNSTSPPPLSLRSPGWYDLSTVVVHVGKLDAGHYICYAKRDDQWFKFDDSKVMLASEAQVLNADAYMLFYVIRSLGNSGEKDKGMKEKEKDEADGDGEGGDSS